MSADGKIALRGGNPLAISDEADLRRVHDLRARSDAILVGIGTVLADDPSLLTKAPGAAKQPIRVVLDSKGQTPPNARVLNGQARTLVFVAKGNQRRMPNAECVEAGEGRVDLRLALRELAARGVQSVMVEGGATIIGAFLRASLVDELSIFVAPLVVGGGAPSLVEGPGAVDAAHVLRMKLVESTPLGSGVLLRFAPR
jgi:2,5-diamino-6-(ribosylamino)-4(3H)-pyrimidinone 5'-phosphate reductase